MQGHFRASTVKINVNPPPHKQHACIMKKTATILLIAVLAPFTVVNNSCECTAECSSALADLITNIAINAAVVVVAGTAFDIPNVIENTRNTVQECKGLVLETLKAGKSQSRMRVDFDANSNNTFSKNEVNKNYFVPEIPPGGKASEQYRFSFNEPGDYRLITYADDKNDVDERDETNNTSDPEFVESGLVAGTGSRSVIIRVLPNPKYNRAENEPFVQILSRTVTVTQ